MNNVIILCSHRFLVARLKSFCNNFLTGHLDLSNCVAVHSLAYMYNVENLASTAAEEVRRNFQKIIHHEEFYELPVQMVQFWLTDPYIIVEKEQELFEAIVKWVQQDMEERQKHFEELFMLLRLGQIPPPYLKSVVRNEPLIANNRKCWKLLLNICKVQRLSRKRRRSGAYTNIAALQPRPGQLMDVIMVVGGVSEGGEYLTDCVGYSVAERRSVAVERQGIPFLSHRSLGRQGGDSLPLNDNFSAFQMAVGFTDFYHAASFNTKNYKDTQQKISRNISGDVLESLPPEVLSVGGAAVCHMDEDIFIFGGWRSSNDVGSRYSREAYHYCAERKRWMPLPPLPQPRCRATACHIRVPYRYLHNM